MYREHGFGLWLLTLKETGEYVGDCGLTPQAVDGVTEIEVGYHVRAALQGRGLATEAAAACRDYARNVLKVDRLIAIIGPRNGHPSGSPRSSAWWSSETATTTAAGEFVAIRTDRCGMGAFELLDPLLACRARSLAALALRDATEKGAVAVCRILLFP